MSDLSQYVSRQELAALTGLTPRAVNRRFAAGVVQVFKDPLDNRRRLIRRDDVSRLLEVVAVPRRADEAAELTAV